jgi:2-polyprenyl-3-methyl-5-hydroxy-6-metoxy-1,4-benzoquinol methylase
MTTAPLGTGAHSWSPDVERSRLDTVAQWYDSARGLNRELVKWAAKRIVRRASGTRVLELGCASGMMTEELARRFGRLDVVEGAVRYASRARELVPPEGRVHHCLFEEFYPSEEYDLIVMAWVLEHVADARVLLSRAGRWLSPGGEIHVVVPNAESLHRRTGLQMGMLDRLEDLNEPDLAIGHRRVYTWQALTADIEAAGLRLANMEGILLKPLPSEMMETLPYGLRAAFFELASLAPRLCSEIYAVCKRGDNGGTAHPTDGLR